MTFTEDVSAQRAGSLAFLARRVRDAVILAAGAVLALPLIVPFA
ncbi:hypothetical protein [Methylorubrum salsuginis]|uniref:Uncharacterized protein n=1 Tax=Methylorubrum salsuginis TaxID=414703 RepID=A0A1I3ZRH6_9HYPH|nr:hypothetical protein [Methylorubrum salsuginis]SFK46281.1 hypothetical protein SAMN04488125_10243 [Methylorubrum salsuginis]